MDVVLIGADFEENLGVGAVAAVAREAGHAVGVVPFNLPAEGAGIAQRVAREAPDVVGLSMQFQHRAHEFLALSRALRRAGYQGHIVAGGQFATLACEDVLCGGYGVDSVVLYDGEETFRDLLAALDSDDTLSDVAGLALPTASGVHKTPARRLADDLDTLPFPLRYRDHTRHVGIPFVPIMAGRGCWGKCSYCSITSYFRDAKRAGGGRTFRLRSPDSVAHEMTELYDHAGEPCIFCFHDDNFLLPKPADSLERLSAIRARLDAHGVGTVGIVGKCRPETLTPELARDLRALGVIRLYVGVENASEPGAAHLNRGRQHLAIGAALDACRQAGIFACYNLLIFEPGASIEDVKENLEFMRSHADHPVNFCRAEPYVGTPLQLELAARQNLGGSYLGFDYRIDDDRTELLFRIAAAVFRERNFRPDGVANRTMGIGYSLKVLEQFYEDPRAERMALARRAAALTRRITLDTAEYLERAIALAERADLSDRDAVERQAALLGLEVAAADGVWQRELDALYADFNAFVDNAVRPAFPQRARRAMRLARSVAFGATLVVGAGAATGCGGDSTSTQQVKKDAGKDVTVVDPPPVDAGQDVMVVDPPPNDAGLDAEPDVTVVDPPPVDAGIDVNVVDPAPEDSGLDAQLDVRLIDQWRDTAPRRSLRSDDLPLWGPPDVRLSAVRRGERVEVTLSGGPDAITTRWQADGDVEGEGRTVLWSPAEDDQLCVAVRSAGGLAFVTLREKSV